MVQTYLLIVLQSIDKLVIFKTHGFLGVFVLFYFNLNFWKPVN